MTTPAQFVPYAADAEEALLGAVIINPDNFSVCSALVTADDFYIRRHTMLWETLTRLDLREQTIDLLTIQNDLRERGLLADIGGLPFLLQLSNAPPTSQHATIYAEIVQRTATRRKMLLMADKIKALALDETRPVDECYHDGLLAYDSIGVSNRTSYLLGSVSADTYDTIQHDIAARRAAGELIGMPMPAEWLKLADFLPRLYPGQLVVISGDSGSGKSALCECLVEHAARQGERVHYIHTEMSRADVLHRRMTRHSGIPFHLLATGDLNDAQRGRMLAADTAMAAWFERVAYHWMPDPKFSQLAQELRRSADAGTRVFVIDHFQDIAIDAERGGNEVRELEAMVTWFSAFAEKRGVYVIIASQQNKDGKTKWSSKLVEKAVVWLSLKREPLKEAYEYIRDNVTVRAEAGEDSPAAAVEIKKARFGKKGLVKMLYDGPRFVWLDLTQVRRAAAPRVLSMEEIRSSKAMGE